MMRWLVILICVLGWLVLAAGILTPLCGMAAASLDRSYISTELVKTPTPGTLLLRSLTLSAVATVGAVILGLAPAAVLGSCPNRRAPVLWGFILAPLLIPPQVYAYAWGLAANPNGPLGSLFSTDGSSMWVGGAVQAGMISAAWLWPVVTMLLAAGWRTSGQNVYALALLDTSPARAFFRAVLPSLRPNLTAAAALVFGITLLEYAIPHLVLSRVYATELQVLVDIGAPRGQIMGMAMQIITIIFLLFALVILSIRKSTGWQPLDVDDQTADTFETFNRPGQLLWYASAAIWLLCVGWPVAVMWASLRVTGAWRDGFILFADRWGVSLSISVVAALLGVAVAVATVLLGRAATCRWLQVGAWAGAVATALAAIMPPVALGVGFIVIFNRPGIVGYLYAQTPVIWSLALAGRYAVIAVLIAWLAVGRRGILAVEQARTDGAGSIDVLTSVLLPMVGPSLLGAGLIIAGLSLFEVVVTQMVGPVGFPNIALTILGHMHYGRDDVVITTSLIVVAAGIIVMQICGWLLMRTRK